jgi:hypothetical protein
MSRVSTLQTHVFDEFITLGTLRKQENTASIDRAKSQRHLAARFHSLVTRFMQNDSAAYRK